VKLDGVEGVAARFHAAELEHLVRAEFVHHQAIGERLRNRLNRERPVAVARREHLSVGGRHTQAKFVGTDLAQFGNVGCDMSFAVVPVLVVKIVEQSLQFVGSGRRCLRHGHRIASAVPAGPE
jgi:hypothetical protein